MELQILDISSISFSDKLFNTTAHNYGHPYWLSFVKPHFEEIDIVVKVLTLENIDKSKPWIVSLPPLMWNWPDYKNDILSEFSVEVQNELILGNAYLIINHECESFTKGFFKLLYEKLQVSKLPAKKIIYMVGATEAQQVHDKFVEENLIPGTQRIKIMSTFHVYRRLDFDIQNFIYDLSTEKKKKFLSLNRIGKSHRLMLIGLLSQNNLLDKGYISLGVKKDELDQALKEVKDWFPDSFDNVSAGLKKIENLLPLQVDNVDLGVNQFRPDSLPTEFYQNSCFSVVSSTFANKFQEESAGLTEKEVKPILYKHPFILYNLPGALKHLRAQGFLSFDQWFDESYDVEQDDFKRLEKIVKEIERLSNISFEEWNVMLKEMRPVLQHNFNRLIRYNSEHVFYSGDLKNLLYYVR